MDVVDDTKLRYSKSVCFVTEKFVLSHMV